MGSWDRYGESKKYTEEADTNNNPKHVGESLRQLTLEDRLELRRQQRELQKKRKSGPSKSAVELLPEDDEISADTQRPSKVARPNSRPKNDDRCSSVLGEDDPASQKKRCDNPVVILAEDDETPKLAQRIIADKTAQDVDLDVEIAPVVFEGARRRVLRKAKAAHAHSVCVLD